MPSSELPKISVSAPMPSQRSCDICRRPQSQSALSYKDIVGSGRSTKGCAAAEDPDRWLSCSNRILWNSLTRRNRLVFRRRFRLHNFRDVPLLGFGASAPLVLSGLLRLSVPVLFAMCHGIALLASGSHLQLSRRRQRIPRQEPVERTAIGVLFGWPKQKLNVGSTAPTCEAPDGMRGFGRTVLYGRAGAARGS
jgi:hypothetical protein